jgi:hypothetical protein
MKLRSTLKLKRLVLLAILTLAVAPLGAALTHVVVADFSSGLDPEGIPIGWQLKEKSGKADFALVQQDGLQALHLRSDETSFSFQKKIDVDTRRFPILSWQWKVTHLPEGGDFRNSGRDDQAAQLFVVFSRTKAIVYIWDTTAPEGVVGDAAAPPFFNIKAVVVRSGAGETGRWIVESRNIYDDFRNIFGHEPPPAQGMRIQINSQHTESSAESFFADITFKRS